MKIVHIGLMKCASSFLQKSIFPHIANVKNYSYYFNDQNLYKKIYDHYLRMLFENEIEFLDLKKTDFVSFEKLAGYVDPFYWEEYSKYNLKALGKDTHIIIVIREPRNFLSSVYLEACIHAGIVIDPHYFFLENNVYSSQILNRKFSIDHFSYSKLIKMYQDKFERVSIIKFEDLFEFNYLEKIFDLSKDQAETLKLQFKKEKPYNISFSQRSVKLLFYLKKFLGLFNLDYAKSHFREVDINLARDKNINKFYEKQEKKIQISKKNFFKKILNFFRTYFNINFFIHTFYNKYFFDKKYMIDFKKFPNIDIKKLEQEYNKLKSSF